MFASSVIDLSFKSVYSITCDLIRKVEHSIVFFERYFEKHGFLWYLSFSHCSKAEVRMSIMVSIVICVYKQYTEMFLLLHDKGMSMRRRQFNAIF